MKPRRGSHDKQPWRSLDLAAITDQTVETQHLHDVHLGETLLPYTTLDPLKAILPLRRGETGLPADTEGVGGISLGALGQRMRDRWQTVSRLWEENRAEATNLSLSGRLDYHKELSSQLEWSGNPGDRPVRVAYTSSGAPTAAVLHDDGALVENVLFWITAKDSHEANYLLAIVNSDTLATAVNKFTTANWAGNTRHLHKHLWKLPILEFDPANGLHVEVSQAGRAAADGAAQRLAQLRQERDRVTVTIARRELRKWLRQSPEGKAVEHAVGRLLRGLPVLGAGSEPPFPTGDCAIRGPRGAAPCGRPRACGARPPGGVGGLRWPVVVVGGGPSSQSSPVGRRGRSARLPLADHPVAVAVAGDEVGREPIPSPLETEKGRGRGVLTSSPTGRGSR